MQILVLFPIVFCNDLSNVNTFILLLQRLSELREKLRLPKSADPKYVSIAPCSYMHSTLLVEDFIDKSVLLLNRPNIMWKILAFKKPCPWEGCRIPQCSNARDPFGFCNGPG